jgi:hypothetical protein
MPGIKVYACTVARESAAERVAGVTYMSRVVNNNHESIEGDAATAQEVAK